jgi:hypothetical protein
LPLRVGGSRWAPKRISITALQLEPGWVKLQIFEPLPISEFMNRRFRIACSSGSTASCRYSIYTVHRHHQQVNILLLLGIISITPAWGIAVPRDNSGRLEPGQLHTVDHPPDYRSQGEVYGPHKAPQCCKSFSKLCAHHNAVNCPCTYPYEPDYRTGDSRLSKFDRYNSNWERQGTAPYLALETDSTADT